MAEKCQDHEPLELAFAFGVAQPEQLPQEQGPEVAFAGRSNAGKSTVINAISKRRKLAFVSKTPGRTQQINFFRVLSGGFLVDLPGYGYAKVAQSVRATWDRLMGAYIGERLALRAVVIVMDARHPFTELDLQLLDFLQTPPRPIHVLLNKADKLNRQQCQRSLREAQALLASRPGEFSVQLFSGVDHSGVDEMRERIRTWLSNDATDKHST